MSTENLVSESGSEEVLFQEEKTIQLRKPITIGTGASAVEFVEITLGEPTAYQLEKSYSANTFTMLVTLISMVGKIPRKVVEKMGQRDLSECSNFLATFSDAVPTIGETLSLN